MKTLPTHVLRLLSMLLGLLLAGASLPATATAATGVVHLTGTVTNTDGVPQNGSVYVKQIGSGGAQGVGISDGAFSYDWDTTSNPDADYVIFVYSSTMDGLTRFYVAGDPSGTADEALATPVHLGPGASDLDITMVLPTIATLSGKVVDVAAAGVGGLGVSINEGGSVRSTTTAADGSFTFGYTRAGTWPVGVGGGSSYLNAQASATVPATGSVVLPDIVVHRAGSISGQVTDSVTGSPVPFVQVVAYAASTHMQLGAAVQSDRDGNYRIGGLGTTPFVLGFIDTGFAGYTPALNDGGDPSDWSPQTPITLSEGEDRAYDQALVLKDPTTPPHTVAGTVADEAGHPMPGIVVTDGDLTTTTDRRGRWYLASADGAHTLRFAQDWHWISMFGSKPGWFVPMTTVTVAAGNGPDDLHETAVPAGRVQGEVAGPGGSGDVGAVEAWAYDLSGTLLAHQDMTDGYDYTLDVPADAPVRVLVRALTATEPRTDLMPRWLGDVDSAAASSPVHAAAGATSSGNDVNLVGGLANLTLPVVSGSAAPGHTLSATTGTWSTHTQTQFTTTWLRDGVAVGSGASYQVAPADAGHMLRVRVTATNGSTSASVLSAPAGVGLVPTTVAARGASPRHGRVKLSVTVSAPGLTPGGAVFVRRGSRVVKARVSLTGGRAVIVLRHQPSGVKRYTVGYSGSQTTLPGTSASVRVRVR